jgi:pimeloyl-ACP methyl ester carboxylesterase
MRFVTSTSWKDLKNLSLRRRFMKLINKQVIFAVGALLLVLVGCETAVTPEPALEAVDPEVQAIEEFLQFRDGMRGSIGESRKITSANGIDVLETVNLNGMDQWISIRGQDKTHPVLLYLHGGPGAVVLPFAYMMAPEWEENFTMVHWDQRGTGKTRCSNPDFDPSTATFEDFFNDTVALVNHLRERLGRQKIIVLGHSWGSVLGLHLAKKHPDLLHAYVGTGQVANTWEGESLGYAFALKEAKRRGDVSGIQALESIAPYPSIEGFGEKIDVQRHFVQEYGGSLQFDYMGLVEKAFFESPEYSVCDWVSFFRTQLGFGEPYPHRSITERMLPQDSDIGNFDLYGYEYEVPIFFFLGGLDRHTPTEVAARLFEKISAPRKKMVLFEKSGHAAPFTEAEKFVKSTIEFVRPLAVEEN